MSWQVTVNLGTAARPYFAAIDVDPLPSGLDQVVVAWRPQSATAKRRRAEAALVRWRPALLRDVRWRVRGNRHGTVWMIAGPFARTSPLYERVLRAICGPYWAFDAEYHQRSGRLLVVDARTDAVVPPMPPDAPPSAPPLDEDDDDNAAEAAAP